MRARKSPHRSNGNPYESTKANRPRLYVRTYDQTQILKALKVQKHQKTAFRRIRLNVPGFVDPVIRSARISGRLFVPLKIGYLHFFDQQLKILKIQKLTNKSEQCRTNALVFVEIDVVPCVDHPFRGIKTQCYFR